MKPLDRKWTWLLGGLLLLGLILLPFMVKNYRVFQFTLVMVYAIAILGLNILTGFNGQISLGHGAFFAFGAYTAAVLMDRFGAPYWSTLPAAAVLCFCFGFVLGFPALRLAGHYLALATFGLALAVPQLLNYKGIEGYTGGVQGIVLTKPEPPFTFRLFDMPLNADRWLYLFSLLVVLVMFLLAWNLLRGRVGRALIAVRDHPIAATAMGINLPMFKSMTFGVSAAFTGVAGALSAIAVPSCRQTAIRCNCLFSCWLGWLWGAWPPYQGLFLVACSSSLCRTSLMKFQNLRLPRYMACC